MIRESADISGDLPPSAPVLQSNEQPQKDLVDNETIFAADEILKHRVVDGKNQYFVKWAGYPKKSIYMGA